jgi:signal transduction histidine kinase
MTDRPATPPPARWPWQRSLQTRIILTYGAVFLVVLALLMLAVGRVVYRAQLHEVEQTLELEAFLAANALEDPLSGYATEFEAYARWEAEHERPGNASDQGEELREHAGGGAPRPTNEPPVPAPQEIVSRLQQVAATYASDTGARVTILDPQGDAVADSVYDSVQVPNQQGAVEVQAALQGGEQHDVRVDSLSGQRSIFAAAPIQQGSNILGLVQLARPLDEATAGIRSLMLSLAAAGLLALLVATVLGIGISRQLIKPVKTLEEASLAIAQGDLNQQVPVDRADELGSLAAAFNHMVQEVRAAMTQQRLFLANASHELRTPLTSIKLRSEALLGSARDDPAVSQRFLGEIDREADRLGRLASALLDLSRLEELAGEAQPLPEPVDIVPVLRSAVATMDLRAGQAGINLAADIPPQLPQLRVWPEQIEAILVNLLDNAVKYTPAGGQVRLSTGIAGDRCLIRVQDTGPGIPPEDLPHIFERFYRVDKARSRQTNTGGLGSGAGLGLSIVRTLVEQNGGHIGVASTPGQGTTFSVELPLAGAGNGQPQSARVAP